MAEAILFTVAAGILKKLASTTLNQISLAATVKRDLIQLEETLETIKAVLLDAEQKQSTNYQLHLWLQRLQDVLYDADNVLDEFAYIALQQQLARRGNSKTKVRQMFTNIKFRFGMGYKIKEIRERLDKIASNRDQFHLAEGVINLHVIPRNMTHSFVDPSDAIGRDTDKEYIVNLLTSSHNVVKLFVIPVVGIGGLGKTTMAKLVNDDSRVNQCFQQEMWVCVSDNFKLQNVIKDIVTAADPECNDCSNLSIDQLQIHLRGLLQGRKYLLVLDDVWNEDVEKWKHLEELLMNGAQGSTIIVTTRSLQIASIMGTAKPYILKGLSNKDCWSLFAKCAFEKGKEKNYPNLVRIGKDIIKMCKGVPLAVRSLGSMLYRKTDEHDWRPIRESEIWRLEENENGILPALRLSYNQLPSHLKRCFAYCSILPKDFQFNSDILTQMWMSQGLIHSSVENEKLEEIGVRYIKELCSRCFFQDIYEFGNILTFKMHDLVHDLALSVTQNECYTINNLHMTSTEKVRHLSLYSINDVPSVVFEWSNLWTLFYLPSDGVEGMSEELIKKCINRFKFLRMFCLKYSSFQVLPRSIGSLIHLRYMDISCNRNIRKLPDTFCKLLHLQTLMLLECSELKGLPRDIGNLINLRALSITAKKLYLLPNKGIGLLTSLRYLQIIECPNLITCDEPIECLPHLRTLFFKKCDHLPSWPGVMKLLPALETLEIRYCEKLNLMDSTNDIKDFRFTSLRYLMLAGLPQLKTLPHWMQNLTSLEKLFIFSCPEIRAMPEGMSHLTSLREFELYGCSLLSNKCERGGEYWNEISHISYITINGTVITRSIDPTYST